MEAPIGCKVGRYGRVEPSRRSRGARSRSAGAIAEGLRHEVDGKIRATTIMPGAVATKLETGTSDAASRKFVDDFYKLAISADSIARAMRYAIEQPGDADVDQIVVRPTVQEF